jgi:GTPase SAR1 family protein
MAAPIQHEVGIIHHVVRSTVATERLLILGEASCGKTALLRALCGGAAPREYAQTSAPAVSACAVAVPASGAAAAASVNFILVDVPGGTVYNMRPGSDLSRGLLSGVGAVAICFSVDSRESLSAAGKWLRLAPPGVPGVLVGCKADLRGAERAVVGGAEAGAMAASLGLHYFEASANSGEGVRAPFEWLAGGVAAGAAAKEA